MVMTSNTLFTSASAERFCCGGWRLFASLQSCAVSVVIGYPEAQRDSIRWCKKLTAHVGVHREDGVHVEFVEAVLLRTFFFGRNSWRELKKRLGRHEGFSENPFSFLHLLNIYKKIQLNLWWYIIYLNLITKTNFKSGIWAHNLLHVLEASPFYVHRWIQAFPSCHLFSKHPGRRAAQGY